MFYCIVGVLAGILFGALFTYLVMRPSPMGDLLIDNSDEDTHLFVELYVHPNEFKDDKLVTFRVIFKNFLQEPEVPHD